MIKLEKIAPSDDPDFPSEDWESHNEGTFNYGSLPVDYTLKGTHDSEIEEGRSIVVFRSERNGTRVPGVTTTSAVQSVEDHGDFIIAKTQNSIYKITDDDS